MFIDENILNGMIDLHIHVGPDYVPRYGDSIRLAKEASARGMKAIVIKTHLASTVGNAHAANQLDLGTKVFGGIALNGPTGGLNVRTVIATIKSGGKMIWLPTVDAEYAIKKAESGHWIKAYVNGSSFGRKRELINILDNNGKLKEEVQEILRVCKEYDVILGTGHISPEECLALAKESKAIGYDKLEVTHPNAWTEDFTIPVLKELTSLGATLTLSYGVCSPHNGRQDPREIVNIIKEVKAENCCLISDYGQVYSASPVEGFRAYCYVLLRFGVTEKELDIMTKDNPSRLLNFK
ncbi:DUF6282 family protein [Thermosediminibacter litoriperuensis]|uniref:DUF6282 family protein n=1 Tax=Thermosediminibacter litoriperuensis TaxID=291989 RepID=UPI0011E807C9|nr:DUF6282 family protein [Thermosediminibacter litoriperuensis]